MAVSTVRATQGEGGRRTVQYRDLKGNTHDALVIGAGSSNVRTVKATTVDTDETLVLTDGTFHATRDIGATVVGDGIPAGATIVSITDPTTAELSEAATATDTDVELTITRAAAQQGLRLKLSVRNDGGRIVDDVRLATTEKSTNVYFNRDVRRY